VLVDPDLAKRATWKYQLEGKSDVEKSGSASSGQ